jgi:uncharacterized protein YkwD
MFSHAKSARIRLTLTAALAATVSLLAVHPAGAAACANADLEPRTADEIVAAEKATHCLINRIRRANRVRGLRWNKRLANAADWHAGDMLFYGYFDHERSDGPSFTRRIKRTGYGRSSRGYSLGENIAWGTAPEATPRDMVDAWMASPPHRQNLLRRVFREDGIGIVRSEGETDGDYADFGPVLIYVHEFGKRY